MLVQTAFSIKEESWKIDVAIRLAIDAVVRNERVNIGIDDFLGHARKSIPVRGTNPINSSPQPIAPDMFDSVFFIAGSNLSIATVNDNED